MESTKKKIKRFVNKKKQTSGEFEKIIQPKNLIEENYCSLFKTIENLYEIGGTK